MHRSTRLTGCRVLPSVRYWSHTAVPWPGVGKPIPGHWSQPQHTANQRKTAAFHGGTLLAWTQWLEACPSPVTLQTGHGPASPGQLQGVGCALVPTPPPTPGLCTCLSRGRGKPGTLVAMGMGIGRGVWESKVQNRSHRWEAEGHMPSLVHASCSKRLPFKNRVKDYVIHNFTIATAELNSKGEALCEGAGCLPKRQALPATQRTSTKSAQRHIISVKDFPVLSLFLPVHSWPLNLVEWEEGGRQGGMKERILHYSLDSIPWISIINQLKLVSLLSK